MTAAEPAPAEITWTSRLNEMLGLDGHEPHMLYAGRWYSWDEIRAIASIMRTRTRLVPEDQAVAVEKPAERVAEDCAQTFGQDHA